MQQATSQNYFVFGQNLSATSTFCRRPTSRPRGESCPATVKAFQCAIDTNSDSPGQLAADVAGASLPGPATSHIDVTLISTSNFCRRPTTRPRCGCARVSCCAGAWMGAAVCPGYLGATWQDVLSWPQNLTAGLVSRYGAGPNNLSRWGLGGQLRLKITRTL